MHIVEKPEKRMKSENWIVASAPVPNIVFFGNARKAAFSIGLRSLYEKLADDIARSPDARKAHKGGEKIDHATKNKVFGDF